MTNVELDKRFVQFMQGMFELKETQEKNEARFSAQMEKNSARFAAEMLALKESQEKNEARFSAQMEKDSARFAAEILALKESQEKNEARFSAQMEKNEARFSAQMEKDSARFAAEMLALKESQEKNEARFATEMLALKEIQAETSAEINKLSVLMRSYIGNDAQTVEEYFYQTLKNLMVFGGVKYDEIGRNLKINSGAPEFDIALFNGESIALIEVKKKVHPKDLIGMAVKKITDFRLWYPNYASYKFCFGVATLVTHEDLIRTSKAEQIFLLTQQGENLAYLNEDVRTWKFSD